MLLNQHLLRSWVDGSYCYYTRCAAAVKLGGTVYTQPRNAALRSRRSPLPSAISPVFSARAKKRLYFTAESDIIAVYTQVRKVEYCAAKGPRSRSTDKKLAKSTEKRR